MPIGPRLPESIVSLPHGILRDFGVRVGRRLQDCRSLNLDRPQILCMVRVFDMINSTCPEDRVGTVDMPRSVLKCANSRSIPCPKEPELKVHELQRRQRHYNAQLE